MLSRSSDNNAGQGEGGERTQENRGWKVEEERADGERSKGLEEGEIWRKYATMPNISQSKKGLREKAKKKRG